MSERQRQKELKLAYKLAMPPMGIYRIRNELTGRSVLDKSANAPGMLNRHLLELRMGSHRNRALLADWRALGEAQFSFEVVEWVKERPEPDFDYAAELERLLLPWRAQYLLGSAASYL